MLTMRPSRHVASTLADERAARAGRRRHPAARFRRVGLVGRSGLVGLVLVGLLAGCAGPADGREIAEDETSRLAEQLADNFGYVRWPGKAEWLAAEAPLPDTRGEHWDAQIDFLDWSGELVAPGDVVTLVVRITVTVDEFRPDTFGGRGQTAGSAGRCFRYYHLPLYAQAEYDEIDCPADATPRQPTPAPSLPDDARDRVATVLAEATPQSLDAQVRAAFPEPYVTVDTTVHEGTLVVAVGVPRERDCVVAIRTPDGEIGYPSFDRDWLWPGELGCTTNLYTSPPL
jgi:hypothetical protein